MMLWDSLSIVRLRTQVTQSSPRPLAERTCVLGAVHLSIFCNDCVATEICEKILEVFYRFFHDCVTIEIRETDPRSPVAGGEQFPSFRAPAFTLVSYRGTCDLRTPSQLSRFFPAP